MISRQASLLLACLLVEARRAPWPPQQGQAPCLPRRSEPRQHLSAPRARLLERLASEASADGLDAVLCALGAACAVRRPDFPAPEDGEMCLGGLSGRWHLQVGDLQGGSLRLLLKKEQRCGKGALQGLGRGLRTPPLAQVEAPETPRTSLA